jgi:hypothetical protein
MSRSKIEDMLESIVNNSEELVKILHDHKNRTGEYILINQWDVDLNLKISELNKIILEARQALQSRSRYRE